MNRKFNNKKKTTKKITAILFILVCVFIGGMYKTTYNLKGSDDKNGVYFIYNGVEYQVFIQKTREEFELSNTTNGLLIPDNNQYTKNENQDFCKTYDVHNGHCDCYIKLEDLNQDITVNMNMTGKPLEYNFELYKYENRDPKEIVYIRNEKFKGYGYATNKLTKDEV